MKNRNRILALLLSLSMVTPWITPAHAAHADEVTFEQVENDAVSVSLLEEETVAEETETALYAEDEIVRVSILVDGESLIEQGYTPSSIAENTEASNCRQSIKRQQYIVTKNIERAIGEELDVRWNITMLANIISANVKYGQIEKIAGVKGVEEVHIEMEFMPMVVSEEENTAEQYMFISGGMTQVSKSWDAGYTGVGQRIAIVDTGIDTDHQSFSDAGFFLSLRKHLIDEGLAPNDYDALDLLDQDEISKILPELNAYQDYFVSSAKSLYVSSKIPFGYNYVDLSTNVTHDYDSQGNHGSHVAGISAANRFLADGTDAQDKIWVVGNAPDAQILVMKVFGANGGAYEADIYAAIEDAITLDADTVNLSLGNVVPGNSDVGLFQEVLENLKNNDTTVVLAAGNNSDWANFAQTASDSGAGHLYTEDVNTNTIGTPGSGTNVLTVASVENDGAISTGSLQVNGKMIEYNTNNSGSSQTLRTFASLDTSADGEGTEYDYVLLESYGTEADFAIFNNDELKNKIVLVSRGAQINFGLKAQRAVAAGAAAVIIYNNVAGSINMNLEGYEYDNPCVSITLNNAKKFKAAGNAATASDGSTYYTGKVTIVKNRTIVESGDSYYTMSDFSNWGTTGDLALKPEITAPGGKIYSVNGGTSAGAATDRYIVMSGTSMAAPQISGIGTLVNEFIEKNSYEGEFANPLRGLAQSLMMSTAKPITDQDGDYYSLLQQGAGLVDAAAATSADSYIKMNSKATQSYDDGKVKAELGDDPERTGVYTFKFEIHNLDGAEHTYDLRADVFAQDHFEANATDDGAYKAEFMDKSTKRLGAQASFVCGGNTVTSISVPANGKVVVEATIELSEEAKREYLEEYFINGTYIQAFVFVDAQPDAEGNEGTTHSIPMLAFYGNWTDSSMFWGVSTYKGEVIDNYSTNKTTDYSRKEYFKFEYQWEPGGPWFVYQPENYFTISQNGDTYPLGGNPLVADDSYMPERNAVSNGVRIERVDYNLIRNATYRSMKVSCLDTGEVYYSNAGEGSWQGAFLNSYANSYGMDNITLQDWRLDDLVEDERIELSITFLPEYYEEGKLGENATPGKGATASVTAVVDNTMPHAVQIDLDKDDQILHVTAEDNQYVAAVVLYNASGDTILNYAGAKQEIDPGEEAVFDLDYSKTEERQFLVQVYDYAMNVVTYRLTIEEEKEDILYSGAMLVFNQTKNQWSLAGEDAKTLRVLTEGTQAYNAATSVGNQVFAVTVHDELQVLSNGDLALDKPIYVDTLEHHIVDMAYREADGYIYGVSEENELIRINPATGQSSVVGELPFTTNTLACDPDGNFYSNKYGTGEVYVYTLETVTTSASQDYDFNADGSVDQDDSQILLDFVTGKVSAIEREEFADIDEDGDVDTYDVYLLMQAIPYLPKLLAVAYTTESQYLQTMEVDPHSGILYWASYFTDLMQGEYVAFSYLWSIDTQTGEIERHTDFWDQLTAMAILDIETSSRIPVADKVARLNISMNDKKLTVGQSVSLSAGVSPWNVEDPSIIWASSDDRVAVVNEDGTITAIGTGSCQIIATSSMDESVYAICEVTVSNALVPDEEQIERSELASPCGVDNTAKIADDAQNLRTITLELPAPEALTNGLQTVSIDTTDMTLLGIGGADLISFQQTEGLLTIGYVHDEEVAAGGIAASLSFQAIGCGEDRDVILRELQRNNDHLNVQTAQNLSSHVWGEWEETEAPTCTQEGEKTRTCSECAMVQTEPLPATGEHSWSDWEVTREATCTQKGEESRYCEECFEEEMRETNATGVHQWSDWEEVEAATCTTEGQKLRSCASCGAEETEVIPATGAHSWGEWTVRTQATETEEGLEYRTCTVCKQEQTRAIPATGEHNWSEWEEVKAESCLTEGQEQRKCADCGEVQTRVIPAIGGHSWGEWTVTTQPGEETVGQESRQCDVCGETETKEIPATGHICPSKNFSDLDTGRWYHEGVDYVLNQGYMKGMSDTAFAPDGALTRGQLVTILYRVEGLPSVSGQDNPFTDVAAGRYYTDAIIWAASEGVVNGVGDGLFAPDQEITREQIATILYRFDGAQKVEEDHLSKFSDAAKISNFAKDAMNWAVSEELINGMGNGTVSPKTSATRAQIATILMRYLDEA